MVQIFDSWASHLSPQDFDTFAAPYIKRIIDSVRSTHPNLPIILYISGGGGLLERMKACGPDIISFDGSVDMRDGIARVGRDVAIQVCRCLSIVVLHELHHRATWILGACLAPKTLSSSASSRRSRPRRGAGTS